MTPEYLGKLEAMQLRPTLPHLKSSEHQAIECLLCQHVFIATPKSKIQKYKTHATVGCPKCSDQKQFRKLREHNLETLADRFEFLSDREFILKSNNKTKIEVRNLTCGHMFESHLNRLLVSGTECPICNVEVKRENFRKHHYARVEKSREYKDEFSVYKAKVYALTQCNYLIYKANINPDNLPRVLAQTGIDGYHLDHIVSVRHCFFNDVPPELCAHPDNLRMVPWKENISKHATFTSETVIPEALKSYLKLDNMTVTYRSKVRVIDEG